MKRPQVNVGSTLMFIAFLFALALTFAALGNSQTTAPPVIDIQDLFDQAPEGSTVVVPAGTYGQVRVQLTKPLTIIGEEPGVEFEWCWISGPGHGTLTLVNMRIHPADLSFTQFDHGHFDTVRLHDVEIVGPGWRLEELDYFECVDVQSDPRRAGVLEAPSAAIVLLDTFVAEARGRRVYATLEQGIPFLVFNEFGTYLADDLSMPLVPRIGSMMRLEWSIPKVSGRLIGRAATQAPVHVPQSVAGYWHLTGPKFLDVAVSPSGFMNIAIPNDASLIGMSTAFQVFGPNRYFSRPVTAVVLP